MRKKVAYFVDTSEFGGVERVMLQLLGALDRQQWNPVLVLHDSPGLQPLIAGAHSLDVEIHTVPRLQGEASSFPRLRQGLDAVTGIVPFIRELRRLRPDVFHAHQNWPLACRYALVGAALAGVPRVVATTHLFPDFARPNWSKAQHRVVASAVDQFIAVSNEVAERLTGILKVPAHKVAVVPNGTEDAPPTPQPPYARERFLAPGTDRIALTPARLSPQKGHKFLVAAAALLPDVTFLFAGDGPEREALEAQVDALGIRPRVMFLGYRDDVFELLRISDLVVLPSMFEGLPLCVLEAMAARKPVVASALPGIAEAVVDGQTGYLVAPGDVQALAQSIARVARDETLSQHLGRSGFERVRAHFSIAPMVARVAEVYSRG